MSYFKVEVLAIESDSDPGLWIAEDIVEADSKEAAGWLVYDEYWDERLSITCNPRFKVEVFDPAAFADEYLDVAPEDTENVDEYIWKVCRITREQMIETGLLKDFDEHAEFIGLDAQKSDFSRPVVVTYGDGELYPLAVWDGVHRIMSALKLNKSSILAVVGTKRK